MAFQCAAGSGVLVPGPVLLDALAHVARIEGVLVQLGPAALGPMVPPVSPVLGAWARPRRDLQELQVQVLGTAPPRAGKHAGEGRRQLEGFWSCPFWGVGNAPHVQFFA